MSSVFELFFKYSRETFAHARFVLASGWPVWLLVLLGVLAAVGVAVSLARTHQGLALPKLVTLGLLQTAVLVVALFLFWRPALLSQTLKPKQNSVALLVDTSSSMAYGEGDKSRLQRATEALDASTLPALKREFNVNLYAFAGDTAELKSLDKVPAPGAQTHIGDALLSVLRGAGSGALGAIVLVSDGEDNSSELDAARIAEIASFGVPVDTVGVGREKIPEDLELEDVEIPTEGMPGTTMSAAVSIRHAQGGNAVLKVYDGDAILASKTIPLPNQAGVTTSSVDLDIRNPGLKDLRFTLDALPGERDTANNTQLRPMVVPDDHRSILYIEGEPRWQYKFIRRAVEKDSAIRLASLLRTTPNKFYRQGIDSPDELKDGFPADDATLFKYDALIVGSYAAASLTVKQQQLIKDFVSRRGGTLLMLGGRRGLADGGWGATVVADVLPAQMPNVDKGPSFIRMPAKAVLTDAGALSPITRLANGAEANRKAWEGMPETADFQHLGTLKPGAVVLLDADFQGKREPLLVEQHYGLGNAYILATGGTWRWQMQLPHEDQRQETFWKQLLQTMATSAPPQVTLTTDRVFYPDESRVVLRAAVRDRHFEPSNEATVTVAVDGPAGPSSLAMKKEPGEPGVYRAVYDAAAAGAYRFDAKAEAGGEELGSAETAVRREDNVAENFHLEQNRPLLERLSAATGGHYFSLADVGKIPDAVRFSAAGVVQRQILDLWNMPAAFLLLLLLKGSEWLLRLRWGRL
ncbi:MAG TPA: hypothetical protein VFY39_06610 [Gammaproteobacteria bacterium]|nr:hypothetical protein [Gammaproteobacteria bacterium]